MVLKIEGEKYNFEVVSKNDEQDFCFFRKGDP